MSENAVQIEGTAELDFSKIKVTGVGGLRSINADQTKDQLLTGKIEAGLTTPQIIVADDGVGGHSFDIRTQFGTVATPAGVPFLVPNATPTVVLTLNVPAAGLWYFTANANVIGPIAITALSTCRIFNGVSAVGEAAHSFGGGTQGDGHSVVSYLLQLSGGETITLEITQENSGLGAFGYNCVLDGVRLGI